MLSVPVGPRKKAKYLKLVCCRQSCVRGSDWVSARFRVSYALGQGQTFQNKGSFEDMFWADLVTWARPRCSILVLQSIAKGLSHDEGEKTRLASDKHCLGVWRREALGGERSAVLWDKHAAEAKTLSLFRESVETARSHASKH